MGPAERHTCASLLLYSTGASDVSAGTPTAYSSSPPDFRTVLRGDLEMVSTRTRATHRPLAITSAAATMIGMRTIIGNSFQSNSAFRRHGPRHRPAVRRRAPAR